MDHLLFIIHHPHSLKTSKMADKQLTATYASPSEEQTFSKDLPASNAGDVKAKTAYLSALRSNISNLQSDVNAFLTRKMEAGNATGGKRADADAKAEEMYGEEEGQDEA